jgi:plasmid maintenance system antidote protein VapI
MTKTLNRRLLTDFIEACGGFVSAAQRLAVQPFTLRKLLHRRPISTQSKQRIEAVLGNIGAVPGSSARSNTAKMKRQHHVAIFEAPGQVQSPSLGRLTAYIKECGLHTAAENLKVRPSSLKKVLCGQQLSPATRKKLDSILGVDQRTKASSDLNDLSSKLRSMIGSRLDVIELAERFQLRPSSIQKIIDGKSVSPAVHDKISLAIEKEPTNGTNERLPMVERLQEVHRLYNVLGTLAAVGKKIGVTRERVRQLLEKGTTLGLFEYKPFDYPFVSKETILSGYKEQLSLGRVAKTNHITPTYLRKLLTAYSITEEDLRSLLIEGHKAKCIKQYNSILEQLGHHPTTTELQKSKSWRYLSMKITRLWGSFDSFRDELDIPKPSKGSATFSEDTRKWREERQRLALIVRMQHLDRIRECLNTPEPMSTTNIAYECGLPGQRTLALLKLLLATGEVVREGNLSSTKYRLSTN